MGYVRQWRGGNAGTVLVFKNTIGKYEQFERYHWLSYHIAEHANLYQKEWLEN